MAQSLSEERDYHSEAEELLSCLPLLRQWAKARLADDGEKRRAFIIEFGGMPKAGKSSVIETIRHYFSHGPKLLVKTGSIDKKWRLPAGYQVHTPAEGVSLRTPNYLKSNLLDFNTWAGAYALQELLQASHDHYHDIVILDRGPWDAGCWLQYVKENQPRDIKLPEHSEKIAEFFQLSHWMTLADLHVVLIVDPQKAEERERRERLIKHGGATSDRTLMTAMQRIYETYFKTLQKTKACNCPHVGEKGAILVNTTGMETKAVALNIICAVFDVLRAKIDNRQDVPQLTVEMVMSHLEGYLKNMRPKEKKSILDYSRTIVSGGNKLEPDQRRRLVEKLSEYQVEETLFNRVTPDTLKLGLATLLEDVAARK